MKIKTIKPLEINQSILDKFNPEITIKKEGRKQFDFWKVVNYDADSKEVTVLDYAFTDTLHGEAFNGCTGSKFDIISKAEYKERTSKENVINYLIDSGILGEHSEQMERKVAEVYYKELKANNELDSFIFDNSYEHLHDYLRKELKLNKTEAYTFSCSGGGRCFDESYKGNINPELTEVINQFESK